jgi:hypothetical protein
MSSTMLTLTCAVGLVGGLQPKRQPGLSDQDVDLGELRGERRGQLLDGGTVAHIESRNKNQILAELVNQGGESVAAARRGDDAGAGGCAAARDRLADARARPRDQYDLWWRDG